MALQDLEDLIDHGILDPEEEDDAMVITAITMQVDGETLTDEQTALLEKYESYIWEALEEARDLRALHDALDKDD
jgi:formaldehyde-activating enzyme involved in methanogenesis